jgi:hypothetical protein
LPVSARMHARRTSRSPRSSRAYRLGELRAGLEAEPSPPFRAALLQGGSAPDALRHGLKSVGQAARADSASTADSLRHLGLPRCRACHRDGKEQLGIRLPTGPARHPAEGAHSGRYWRHRAPPARLRKRRHESEPHAAISPRPWLNACSPWGMSEPPAVRLIGRRGLEQFDPTIIGRTEAIGHGDEPSLIACFPRARARSTRVSRGCRLKVIGSGDKPCSRWSFPLHWPSGFTCH